MTTALACHSEEPKEQTVRDERTLRQRLHDRRLEVRRDALRSLIALRPTDLDDLLVRSLEDRSRRVRRIAATAARQRGESAVPVLLEQLYHPSVGPWCAAILASTWPGRRALYRERRGGLPSLTAACEHDDIPVALLIGVTKSLAVALRPGETACLARLLSHRSPMLRDAAGRALRSMDDPSALPWVLERGERGFVPDIGTVQWLGELGDVSALPYLRRLSSFWSGLMLGSAYRRAVRRAIATIEATTAGVSSAAISRAAPPGAGPTEAAISLWREDVPAEADDASDD